eukprot:1184852-Prorocentrum_minimum.AAC.5
MDRVQEGQTLGEEDARVLSERSESNGRASNKTHKVNSRHRNSEPSRRRRRWLCCFGGQQDNPPDMPRYPGEKSVSSWNTQPAMRSGKCFCRYCIASLSKPGTRVASERQLVQ